MKQVQGILETRTRGIGLYDFTDNLAAFVQESGLKLGQVTLFCRHTSASLLIQENADPTVKADLLTYFAGLAPEGEHLYAHHLEGPDDMPAHLRTALTQTHLVIPFVEGRLLLGTWQGVYLFEHRRAPHRREIVAHAVGE